MDLLLSLLILLIFFLVSYFLNREKSPQIYGMPYSQYNSLPHSQQKTIRQEWYLDNNQEAIDCVKNISQRLLDNHEISETELLQMYTEIKNIEYKYDPSGTNYLSYDIKNRIEVNKKQSVVEDQGQK